MTSSTRAFTYLRRGLFLPFAVLGLVWMSPDALSMPQGAPQVAFTHNAPYPGSNNYPAGATKDAGFLQVEFNPGYGPQPAGSYIQWGQAAIDWIRSNRSGTFDGNQLQTAIVFHAFVANSSGSQCAAAQSTSTFDNLPGSYVSQKSSCGVFGFGVPNETRIYIGNPNELTVCGPNTVDCNGYYAQASYQDLNNTATTSRCDEVTIDNYRVDTIPFENGLNKDFMAKYFYNVFGAYESGCP